MLIVFYVILSENVIRKANEDESKDPASAEKATGLAMSFLISI
jgi:hypothetical protein